MVVFIEYTTHGSPRAVGGSVGMHVELVEVEQLRMRIRCTSTRRRIRLYTLHVAHGTHI